MQGWIKLQRKIQNHWIYQEKRVFSRYEAWLDLIMMANHKDNKALIDGKLIDVVRGEFITSIRKLCDRWNWSNTKVTTFLKLLESDEMITYKSDTKKTVVTIVNYGLYHDKDNEETTQKRHRNVSETYQKHTNKNVKNVKNDKEKNIVEIYDHYISKGIINHNKITGAMRTAINARLKDYSFEQLIQAIDNYSIVYSSDDYWFTHKYGLTDLMRDKDVRRFIDDADPLGNHLKDGARKSKPIGYDPNKDAF